MSESTNDSSSTSAGAEESSSYSDILEHLPPEVAQALGQSKKAEPAPKDAEEEEVTDGAEETESPAKEQSEDSDEEEKDGDEESTDEEKSDEEGGDRSISRLEKRIDKLTRRRREAESAAEELRAENERLKTEVESRSAIRLEPTPEDPLADIETAADLESKVHAAKKVRAWALSNPDGATVTNPDGTERYVDRSEMAKFIAQTDALLTDHAPARKEYLRERDAILPEAMAAYPDLFKPGTQQYQIMVDTLKLVPALKRLPGYKLVIGDALIGMQLRMEKHAKSKDADAVNATKKSAPAAKAKIAPAIPKPTPSRPPSSTGKEKGRNLDRVIAGGGIDDLAQYFAAA